MDNFDAQRKEFMKHNGFHPLVQQYTKKIKGKAEYEVILKDKENSREKSEVIVVLNNNDEKVYENVKEDLNFVKKAKKAAAAVSGGALVVVGIPLIPVPSKNE